MTIDNLNSFTDQKISPVAFCNPEVRYIFPVRYALKGEVLKDIFDGTRSSPPPAATTIKHLPYHDLRRIRAGYIYIFGIDQDGKKIWRVFRYLASSTQDDNSIWGFLDSQIVDDANYQFYELEWTDGADSRWEKKTDSSLKSYIEVSINMTQIHIAYSEERWPALMFEALEANESLLNKAMTKVNLEGETDVSFHYSQLENKVIDFFTHPLYMESLFNLYRHTQLKQEEASGLDFICEKNRPHARVVALRDDLGEILDIGASLIQISHVAEQYNKENYYATSIAELIDKVRDRVNKKPLWGDKPLSPIFDKELQKIKNGQKELKSKASASVAIMEAIFNRTDSGSLQVEIQLINQAIEALSDNRVATSVVSQALDYNFFLIGRSWELSSTIHSDKFLIDKFTGEFTAIEKKREIKGWVSLFINTLNKFNTLAKNREMTSLRHFRYTISSQSLVFATVLSQFDWGLRYMDNILIPLNLKLTSQKVKIGNLADVIRSQFDTLGFPSTSNRYGLPGVLVGVDANTYIHVPVLDDHRMQIDIEVTEEGYDFFRHNNNLEKGLLGAGIMVGFYSIYSAFESIKKTKDYATTVGQYANNPYLNIMIEVISIADSIITMARQGSSLGQEVASQTMRNIFSSTRLQHLRWIPLPSSNGIAARFMSWSLVGKVTSGVGILFSIFNAWEDKTRGDITGSIGNSIIAAGGLIMLFAGGTGIGIVAGLIVSAIGIVITAFSDDELQEWTRGSFWGSGDYFYWKQKRKIPFEKQLTDSKKLAYNDPQMLAFYEKEYTAFCDLTWTLEVVDTNTNDSHFEVFYPGITSQEDANNLKLTIYGGNYFKVGSRYNKRETDIDNANASVHYVSPGVVIIKFDKQFIDVNSQYDQFSITASYPKRNSNDYISNTYTHSIRGII